MFNDEDFVTVSGILLSRKFYGENVLSVTLFLKEIGIAYVKARKSTGETEPFTCGRFSLRKLRKGRSYYIEEVEVVDDMFDLRTRKESLFTAQKFVKLLTQYLTTEHPDDYLLANLYWNMKLLCSPRVPADAVLWRFLWRWLIIWGLAPDFVKFYISMNFNDDEIIFMAKIINYDVKDVINLFSEHLSSNIRENIFKIASKSAVKFLNEK